MSKNWQDSIAEKQGYPDFASKQLSEINERFADAQNPAGPDLLSELPFGNILVAIKFIASFAAFIWTFIFCFNEFAPILPWVINAYLSFGVSCLAFTFVFVTLYYIPIFYLLYLLW